MNARELPSNAGVDHLLQNQAIIDEMDQALQSYLYQAQRFTQDLDPPNYNFLEVDERTEVSALVINLDNGQWQSPGLDAHQPNYFDAQNGMFYDPIMDEPFSTRGTCQVQQEVRAWQKQHTDRKSETQRPSKRSQENINGLNG